MKIKITNNLSGVSVQYAVRIREVFDGGSPLLVSWTEDGSARRSMWLPAPGKGRISSATQDMELVHDDPPEIFVEEDEKDLPRYEVEMIGEGREVRRQFHDYDDAKALFDSNKEAEGVLVSLHDLKYSTTLANNL